MNRDDEERDADARSSSGVVGDVETAGETTAAAVTGVEDGSQQPPVGADTLVEVAGDEEEEEQEEERSEDV